MRNYLNVLMMVLWILFYPSYGQSVPFINGVMPKIQCIISLTDSISDSRMGLSRFNEPLRSVRLHQRVLFPINDEGFSYGLIEKWSDTHVMVSYREKQEAVVLYHKVLIMDGVGRFYEYIPHIVMREDGELFHEWMPRELLRRNLRAGDFIRYNPRLLGNIWHGMVTEVDGDGIIFVKKTGWQDRLFSSYQSFRELFRRKDKITPREIITVIDEDPEQYWANYHNEQTGL